MTIISSFHYQKRDESVDQLIQTFDCCLNFLHLVILKVVECLGKQLSVVMFYF